MFTGAGAYPFLPFTGLSLASSRPAATVASYHMATLPSLYWERHSLKLELAAAFSPASWTTFSQNCSACLNAGWSPIALSTEPSGFADHHVPPKVFSTVVNAAPRSPQPGLPRRQIPAMLGVLTLRAASATCVHVGWSGSVTPAFFRTSLRYMRNDGTP